MRNYFSFSLRGKQLFPYWITVWTVSIAVAIYVGISNARSAGTDPALDWHYAGHVALQMLLYYVTMLASYLFTFFSVRFTAEGLSLGGERLETRYEFRPYLLLCAKGLLFSVITFGIYLPWFIARVVRYFADNTVFRFNQFRFNGNPMTLFGFTAVFVLVPYVLLLALAESVMKQLYAGNVSVSVWMLPAAIIFFILLCFYIALSMRWFMDFYYGPKRIATTVRGWRAGWFITGQLFLSIITVGFYAPMTTLRIYRYYVSRIVLGGETVEDRFGFTLDRWHDYGYLLGQMLLALITLGVYMPWAYAKIITRLFTHTFVEPVEEQRPSMP